MGFLQDIAIIKFIITNGPAILAALQSVAGALALLCSALVALFMLIPGAQPELFLQKCVDFLSKYSKK